MKKILTLLLVCCAAFAFANDEPIFEESDESVQLKNYGTFAAEEPIFEEEETQEAEEATQEEENQEPVEEKALHAFSLRHQPRQQDNPKFLQSYKTSYVSWKRYRANFGMEKLFVRFPQEPAISQSNTFLTAYAYDHAVLYSLTGYYPPVGNIHPGAWFDDVLYSVSDYPYRLISHTSFQACNGDWVLDYVTHDYVQNLIIKARAIVTPFNAYTLQCVKPNGARDNFEYFLDHFLIKCECH